MRTFPEFTYKHKCIAMAAFYYLSSDERHEKLVLKRGDLYTIRRGDLELFRVEEFQDGAAIVSSNTMKGTMKILDFGSDSFHVERVPVPEQIFS